MIEIDSRAGSGELIGLFPKGVAKLAHLEYGDMAWVGKGEGGCPIAIGVERKAIHDLVNSMGSGRLQSHQLPGMRNCYQIIYLVVEGIWRPNPHSGIVEIHHSKRWEALAHGKRRWMYAEIEGFLNTLDLKGGVHYRRTGSKEETAQLVTILYNWSNKEWDKHRSHMAIQENTFGGKARFVKPGLVQRMAAQLPGIGWERSTAIADTFSSPEDMVDAPQCVWEGIDGVGKELAERIKRMLREGK
jgi:ERCC4-type nuclease